MIPSRRSLVSEIREKLLLTGRPKKPDLLLRGWHGSKDLARNRLPKLAP